MTSPQVPPTDPAAHGGHETSDVKIRGLLWLAAGLIAMAVVVHVVLWLLLKTFEAQAERADPQISPLASEEQLPPEPQLQEDPLGDYQTFHTAQEKLLNSYGWIDKQQEVVRIPVSRAMELLLERGLPEPEGSASPESDAATEEGKTP
jgi:hypothetical protein